MRFADTREPKPKLDQADMPQPLHNRASRRRLGVRKTARRGSRWRGFQTALREHQGKPWQADRLRRLEQARTAQAAWEETQQ